MRSKYDVQPAYVTKGQEVEVLIDGDISVMVVDGFDATTGSVTLLPKVLPSVVEDGVLYNIDVSHPSQEAIFAGETGWRRTDMRGKHWWSVVGLDGRIHDTRVTVNHQVNLVSPRDLWLACEGNDLVVPQDKGADLTKNVHAVADDLWGGLGGKYWEAVGLSLLAGCGGEIARCCAEHGYHVNPHKGCILR